MSRRERRLAARKFLSDGPAPSVAKSAPSGRFSRFLNEHYFKLQFITIVILVLSIAFNIFFFASTGDFVRKGVSLAGGSAVSVSTSDPVDTLALESFLATNLPNSDISVRILRSGQTQTGFTVEASLIENDPSKTEVALVGALKQKYPDASYSVETTGPSLGNAFFVQTLYAVLVAFILMSIVVFISFRTFVPSMAVVLAGFSTVVSTLAVFNLMGFALSTAGVAAFLMLIGYSIDTDILLSTRVLRQGGSSFMANVWSAAKTGLTMQATTAIAVTVVLIFSNNPVFTQIMTIILIGMVFDVLYTWIQNVAILKWYVENKEAKK